MVRIGILSTAHMHVWSYVSAVQQNPDSELVGVWDDEEERLLSFCSQTGAKPYQEIDALLEQCDAVIITSENSRHSELAEKAARAGKHILCEKPLIIPEEQADHMLKAHSKA